MALRSLGYYSITLPHFFTSGLPVAYYERSRDLQLLKMCPPGKLQYIEI